LNSLAHHARRCTAICHEPLPLGSSIYLWYASLFEHARGKIHGTEGTTLEIVYMTHLILQNLRAVMGPSRRHYGAVAHNMLIRPWGRAGPLFRVTAPSRRGRGHGNLQLVHAHLSVAQQQGRKEMTPITLGNRSPELRSPMRPSLRPLVLHP
jgi:hypothetical protein